MKKLLLLVLVAFPVHAMDAMDAMMTPEEQEVCSKGGGCIVITKEALKQIVEEAGCKNKT